MKILSLFFMLCIISVDAKSSESAINTKDIKNEGVNSFNKGQLLSARLAENKGQIVNLIDGTPNNDVKFSIRLNGIDIYVFDDGISYQFKKLTKLNDTKIQNETSNASVIEQLENCQLETYRVDMRLQNSNKNPHIIKVGDTSVFDNFYNHHVFNVKSYDKVIFQEVYDGIDWVVYVVNEEVKYDFIVKPWAKLGQIKLKYTNYDQIVLDDLGNLIITTKLGSVKENAPVSFQNEDIIKSKYELENGTISFSIGDYDSSSTLIIDPYLVFASYYGGAAGDVGTSISVDQNGNFYIAGYTESTNGIASGGYQNTFGGGQTEAFLTKFSSTCTRLWSTYYGGLGNSDFFLSTDIDLYGNVFASGFTSSSNGISYKGHQDTFGGNTYDVFLVKFNSNGNRIWSTYYGGNNPEVGGYCKVNSSGDIYLCGSSRSANQISYKGFQNAIKPNSQDGFLVKFNQNGKRQWATYYGGNKDEWVEGIDVDTMNNVFICGRTLSDSGFVAGSAYQIKFGGGNSTPKNNSDAFLIKFDANGGVSWGTYFGGGAMDGGRSCAADQLGNVYLCGYTKSTNAISFKGFQNSFSGTEDGFFSKFNSKGQLIWSSYYGLNNTTLITDCKIDYLGDLVLVGVTTSDSGISYKGFQNNYKGGTSGASDILIVKFDSSGARKWGTYFGGTDGENIYRCALDFNNIYISGGTSSTSGLTYKGYQNSYLGGLGDAFFAKIGDCQKTSKILSVSACKSYTWKGNTYTQSGDYTYTTTNYLGCDSVVTLKLNILKSVSTLVKLSVCDSFIWKGKTYKTNTSFYDTLKSYQVCDSIVESQFIVKNSSSRNLSVAVCNQYIWHNDTLTNTGTYYDTSVNAVGCDSITRLDLIIYPSLSTNIKATACKSFTWYGNTYTSNGIYTKKLQSIHGCDSTVFLSLSISKYTRDTILVNTCNKQYNWRGKVIIKTGIYFDTTQVSGNCDSIHVLQLNLTPIGFLVQAIDQYKTVGKTAKYFVQSAQPGVNFQWQSNLGFGWINLNNAGQYLGVNTDTLYVKNVILSNDNHKYRCIVKLGNCTDTSSVASLYVCPLITEQPVRKYTGAGGSTFFTVKCDIANASFQWQADNGSGFQNLSNAGLYKGVNTNTLMVSNVALTDNNTLYRCIVTYMNCQDTTDNAALLVLEKFNINLCNNNSFVNVYPNPTHNFVNVLLPSDKVDSPYKITNDLGQVLKTGHITAEESTVDFKEFPSGVYILTIGDELLDCFKIVKIWDR